MNERRLRAWSATLNGAIIALLVLLVAGIAATGARAGIYRATQCNPSAGASRADASFSTTSPHYVPSAHCGVGDRGLMVVHEGRETTPDRWGGWTLAAPPGTELVGARATVGGRRQGGHAPELVVAAADGTRTRIGDATGDPHTLRWTGSGGDLLIARLRCVAVEFCGAGEDAFIAAKRLVVTLDDLSAPSLGLAGSLFDPGSRRGVRVIEPLAADSGGGVRGFVVDVNGVPIRSEEVPCATSGDLAIRLRPCPAHASAALTVSTATSPFVQGRNDVRVCTFDHADDAPNRACEERIVRVDNACPVSDVATGAQLLATINGLDQAKTARGEEATVAGRLLNAQGAGVEGARVCVATRIRLDGEPETVLASPLTRADGSFSVAVPAGPSRAVRVAYWPDEDAAVERSLALETRADPELRLSPRRTLHNGDRVRFRIRIPGPANGAREVRLQVRADGHWQELRTGHTDADGAWRTGYRFRATTGRRRYAFRAICPEQAGYPYAAGRSPVRHQIVVGD